jgi:hypothetical protein
MATEGHTGILLRRIEVVILVLILLPVGVN